MITFLISVAALIAGYFLYGKFVERIFRIDTSNSTPANTLSDGVDSVSYTHLDVYKRQPVDP